MVMGRAPHLPRCVDRVTGEAARHDLGPEMGRCLVARAGRPIRPQLGHGVIRVVRAKDRSTRSDRLARQPMGVTRAIEALVVLDSDGAQRGERRREGEHPLAQIRVQADPLQLGLGQPATLVPDGVGDAEAAEVVHEPSLAERHHLGLRQSVQPRGLRREIRHPARVPDGERRLEIGEVPDRLEGVVEALLRDQPAELWLRRDDHVPAALGIEVAQQRRCVGLEQLHQLPVEMGAAALLRHPDGRVDASAASQWPAGR
jgi:hypothetical protein